MVQEVAIPVDKNRESEQEGDESLTKDSVVDSTTENLTMPSSASSSYDDDDDEENENSTASDEDDEDNDDDDDGSSYSEEDDYSDEEMLNSGAASRNKKSKRVSYSKDMLKPTKEGSLIQAGVDLKQVSVAETATPAYVNKQLKPTGFGEKVKQGADVPRDHVPQPVDPNAHLGDVYKSQSSKFKSTGFGDKLKQGADVPRDHIPQKVDPNASLGDLYKSQSTKFKSTGFGEKLKQGQDVARENASSSKTGDSSSKPFAAVTLKKTGNPDEKRKSKKSTPSTAFPVVALQKTGPIEKEGPKKFELPQEFSTAKQNLKRRTDRPWYSEGVSSSKPTKKWFFQRGEWNNGEETKSNNHTSSSSNKSWFFGGSKTQPDSKKPATPTALFRGSNTTMITTAKMNTQHYNVVPNTTNNNKGKKKSSLKPYNKQYYEEIQRRRKGLPPKPSLKKRLLRAFFYLFMVVPCVVVAAVYVGMQLYPQQAQTVWKHIGENPHLNDMMTRAQPVVKEAVDRICTPVEAFVVPFMDHQFLQVWIVYAHVQTVSACSLARKHTGMTTVEDHERNATADDDREKVHDRAASSVDPETKNYNPLSKSEGVQKEKAASSSSSSSSSSCTCDRRKPKWFQRMVRFILRKNKKKHECCLENSRVVGNTNEKEL